MQITSIEIRIGQFDVVPGQDSDCSRPRFSSLPVFQPRIFNVMDPVGIGYLIKGLHRRPVDCVHDWVASAS